MTGAVEFLIVLLLLIVAIGELSLFLLAFSVIRRSLLHSVALQQRLEEQVKETIPAGIFRPIQRGDGTVALFPVEDGEPDPGPAEDANEWLNKMAL